MLSSAALHQHRRPSAGNQHGHPQQTKGVGHIVEQHSAQQRGEENLAVGERRQRRRTAEGVGPGQNRCPAMPSKPMLIIINRCSQRGVSQTKGTATVNSSVPINPLR